MPVLLFWCNNQHYPPTFIPPRDAQIALSSTIVPRSPRHSRATGVALQVVERIREAATDLPHRVQNGRAAGTHLWLLIRTEIAAMEGVVAMFKLLLWPRSIARRRLRTERRGTARPTLEPLES